MPRIRAIKPEFFDSPHVATVSAVVRLAYIGLWCWADDTGRGTCNPKELEGFIFPHDDLSELSHGEFADFRGILPQLAAAFGVVFYTVNGRMFYDIPTWERHQRVRDKTSSRYPSPEEGEPLEFCQKNPQSDNPPQSAATCRETPPGTGEQGNRGTGEQGNISCATADADCAPNPDATPEPKPEEYSQDFLTFWAAYPIRRNKRAAWRRWKEAIKRAPAKAIIAGAQAYANDPNREDRFTKYPEGWLNGDGWEDQQLPNRGLQGRDQVVNGWLEMANQYQPQPEPPRMIGGSQP